MTIDLYYIEGISETDTLCPINENITGKIDRGAFGFYMTNHRVQSVEASYYPPYYRNRITLSNDDITFNKEVNYLRLYDADNVRSYYYFIRSFNYVSENVISLDIEMDVITTYMFDIELSNVVIERKFIDRWNSNGTINRDYIRENVSRGDMILSNVDIFSVGHSVGWYIIKCKSGLDDNNYPTFSLRETINTINVQSPYIYYFMPVGISASISTVVGKRIQEGITAPTVTENSSHAYLEELNIRNLLAKSIVVNAYFIPYDIMGCTLGGTTLYLPSTLGYFEYDTTYTPRLIAFVYMGTNSGTNVQNWVSTFSYDTYKDITFSYSQNNDTEIDFDKKYVPCLVDENYQRVSIGEGNNNASLPLYYLTSTTTRGYMYFDAINGSRIYRFQTGTAFASYALDSAILPISNAFNCELLTDTYDTWYRQNRATFMAGALSSTINSALSFTNFATGRKTELGNIKALRDYNYETDMTNADFSYDRSRLVHPRTMYGKDLTKFESMRRFNYDVDATNAQRRRDAPIGNVSYNLSNPLGFAITYGENAVNNYYAPDIPTSTLSLSTDLYSLNYIPHIRYYQVSDLDYCAWYYHMNGYLVMEKYDNCTLTDLMKYTDTRTYFNVLKLADCDVHLKNVIESTELVNLIKNRLVRGLRLWNTETGGADKGIVLDNLKYDNVEK